jgi:DNA-binding IclR family transcriptional regulator
VLAALAHRSELVGDPGISKSLIVGLLLLAAFPVDGQEIRLADLAEGLGLFPATAHRYVNTLRRVGLVEQNAATRAYRRTAR